MAAPRLNCLPFVFPFPHIASQKMTDPSEPTPTNPAAEEASQVQVRPPSENSGAASEAATSEATTQLEATPSNDPTTEKEKIPAADPDPSNANANAIVVEDDSTAAGTAAGPPVNKQQDANTKEIYSGREKSLAILSLAVGLILFTLDATLVTVRCAQSSFISGDPVVF